MKSIETQGKTVDQAIEIGLYKLGLTRDDVKIDILEQAGLFNKARVRLCVNTTSPEEAVVKELVENAIDAGSSNIEVELTDGGIKKIKVIDNGIGMKKDEIPVALSPHATSKIKCAEDLFNIGTLGFRGEALPSIVSVSPRSEPKRSLTRALKSTSRGSERLSERPAISRFARRPVTRALSDSTLLPFLSLTNMGITAATIASIAALTARSASFLVRPVFSATAAISSVLFIIDYLLL